MSIDVQYYRAVILFVDDMAFEDFVVPGVYVSHEQICRVNAVRLQGLRSFHGSRHIVRVSLLCEQHNTSK